MPVSPTYPGIYIQELPSQSHTITPAPTSVTVFVGYTHPLKTASFGVPTEIFSFTDYERSFGGLYNTDSVDHRLAYAVQQFFLNGGSTAYVVGLQPKVTISSTETAFFAATGTFPSSTSVAGMVFSALEPADASTPIKVTFSNQQTYQAPSSGVAGGYKQADVTITYGSKAEVFRGVSFDPGPIGSPNPNYIGTVINTRSQLVSVAPVVAGGSLGLLPPLYRVTPTTLPAPTPQTITLAYYYPAPTAPVTGTFAGMPVTFTSKADPRTSITITISNQGTYNTGTGWYSADFTITDGVTTETYKGSNVPSNRISSNPADGAAYILNMLASSNLVTVTASSSPVNRFPPNNSTASDVSITLGPATAPATALVRYFDPGDFTTNSQPGGAIAPLKAGSLLDKLSVFNLMVVPGVHDFGVLTAAAVRCEAKRAFLIMDPPPDDSANNPITSVNDLVTAINEGTAQGVIPLSANAAVYFPYLVAPDPVSGKSINLAPSGFVAGIYARTDQNRGVWKAPAGLETIINNTTGVIPGGEMLDAQAGVLNLAGFNAIRTFPGQGTVVFGARTVVTASTAFEQWRYVPVRRMALFIEQSLYGSLGWAVFEPNDVPLWNALKSTVDRFMLSLFRQGAFQGTTPSQAFLVKCDASTTTQDDIDNGIVNILVGFAPLKPAEFVIIQLTQLAGQASS